MTRRPAASVVSTWTMILPGKGLGCRLDLAMTKCLSSWTGRWPESEGSAIRVYGYYIIGPELIAKDTRHTSRAASWLEQAPWERNGIGAEFGEATAPGNVREINSGRVGRDPFAGQGIVDSGDFFGHLIPAHVLGTPPGGQTHAVLEALA